MNSTDSRVSIRGKPPRRILLPPLIALVALVAALVYLNEPAETEVARDDDLCPMGPNGITGNIRYLVDLSKPVDPAQASLPGELLRDITLQADRDTELRVYSLTHSPGTPRMLLTRLCKPYDNADLQVEEAKDQRGDQRDCDDLPAQVAAPTRAVATRFCLARDALQADLDELAGRRWPEQERVADAYLVEALEDIRLELAELPDPMLYIFSDMMQHARWYSHLDIEWTDWNHGEFASLLESRNWFSRQGPASTELRVEIFYVPRAGTTRNPRAKALHQRFWRNHFAGAQVAFHDQPQMSAYAAAPLTQVASEAEVLARERAALEQLLLEVRREQAALERLRSQLESEPAQRARAQRDDTP